MKDFGLCVFAIKISALNSLPEWVGQSKCSSWPYTELINAELLIVTVFFPAVLNNLIIILLK
jgi:hypothetical protein